MARRNDQAQGRSIQLAVGQMGMGRAAERYEILNACPSLPAVLVRRGHRRRLRRERRLADKRARMEAKPLARTAPTALLFVGFTR